jgi:hypothetical protein
MYMVLNGKFNRITPKFNSSMALVTLKRYKRTEEDEKRGTNRDLAWLSAYAGIMDERR